MRNNTDVSSLTELPDQKGSVSCTGMVQWYEKLCLCVSFGSSSTTKNPDVFYHVILNPGVWFRGTHFTVIH